MSTRPAYLKTDARITTEVTECTESGQDRDSFRTLSDLCVLCGSIPDSEAFEANPGYGNSGMTRWPRIRPGELSNTCTTW
jgi:hypothetical protein